MIRLSIAIGFIFLTLVACSSPSEATIEQETLEEVSEEIQPINIPESSKTPQPTNTSEPEPTNTSTPRPTNTRRPTNTPRPTHTATALPTTTSVPQVQPTNTSAPQPTNTPGTQPTNTLLPQSTDTPVPQATNTLPPPPTDTPEPQAAPGNVIITFIFFDGNVPQVESDEYVEIQNQGGSAVNLAGWRLNADDDGQDFWFPAFDLLPGQSCRIYTNEVHPETCGFSFGNGQALWANGGECGHLYDGSGVEVSNKCY